MQCQHRLLLFLMRFDTVNTLGIEGSKAMKVLQNWHAHSIKTHHAIIKLRRRLEKMPRLNDKNRAEDTMYPYKPP